jgi:hypothetical protein
MAYAMTPTTPHIRPIPKKRVARNISSGPKKVQAWDGQSSGSASRSPVCEIAHRMNEPMMAAKESKFVPVYDVEGYVNALMYHGISEEQAEIIRKEHCEALAKFDKATIEPKKELCVPKVFEPLNVLLEVTGDKVKLILSTSMWKIHEEYFKKFKRPPLGKYVRALANANYPEDKINKVVKFYNWAETWKGDEYDEEFERLFPTTGSKKSAMVKKASKAVKKF